MTRIAGSAFTVALLFALPPALCVAQQAKLLLSEGVAAYNDAEFVAAARLLRRALNPDQKPPLSGSDRHRAHTYLGAAHVHQGERDEGASVFRDLVLENPQYRPDTLVFPPNVTQVFAEVLQTTKAVAVDLPQEQALGPGAEAVTIRVYASSAHQISVAILGASGDTALALFDGPIQDSLTLSWKPAAAGSFRLEIASKLSASVVLRRVRIPLEIQATPADAVLPGAPAIPDSLLLPERRPAGLGVAFLVSGLALGALVMVPSGLGSARFALGGTVAAGGIVGFFAKRPGRPIPENVATNARTRAEWNRRTEATRREPARRPRGTRLVVKAGSPERIEEAAK